MELGERVTRTPITFTDPYREKGEERYKPMTGRVVYIHPEGRYHTVEFDLHGKKIKESFHGT